MKNEQTGSGGLKYIRLREWLNENIESRKFKFGDKLPSENMLATKFSISRQTVRNAIDQLETEGVIRRVRGSGTFVNKLVEVKQRNNNIGVLLSYLDDYIFPQIMRGIEEVLTKEGFGIDLGITHNSVESEARFLERMLETNVAGVVVEGTRSALPNPNLDLYRKLSEMGIPVIFLHNCYQGLDFPKVVMDDAACVRKMVEMLIQAGHRQIAGIFKSDDIQGHWRYKGYIDALRQGGVAICEDNIRWYSTEDFDAGQVLSNDDAALKFMSNCTALVCYNDQIATLAYNVLIRNGMRVPEDISLTGFDDSTLSRTGSVEFTSAMHPKNVIGVEVASRIVRMIKYGGSPLSKFSLTIPAQIAVRPSIRDIRSETDLQNES